MLLNRGGGSAQPTFISFSDANSSRDPGAIRGLADLLRLGQPIGDVRTFPIRGRLAR
jgi:hypothetical protein